MSSPARSTSATYTTTSLAASLSPLATNVSSNIQVMFNFTIYTHSHVVLKYVSNLQSDGVCLSDCVVSVYLSLRVCLQKILQFIPGIGGDAQGEHKGA